MRAPDGLRQKLRRWRWRIAAVVLIVAVRVALPFVLRSVIQSQASSALNARVDVGDVDLRLWRGGVALEEVAVRPAGAPEPPAGAPPGPADGTAPAFSEYSPIIAFKRFAIEIRYLPLFRKTIQLRDVELASPRVALDHLGKGNLNVMALVPSSEVAVEAGATPAEDASPTPSATAAPGAESEGGGWSFGLDQFVLRDGRLRFRDLALEGSEPVEVGIDEVHVDEIALAPGVYGEPARIHLKLGVDEGAIDVNARLTLAGGEVTVVTDVDANRLPLRRARLYIPNVGWSDLRGELDLALTYELEPKAKNSFGGTLALRDVAVTVPNLEDVAISWKSLAVTIDTVDLLAQRAALADVALDGALVTVQATGGEPLPWLAETGGTPAPTPPGSPAPSASPSPAAAGAEKAPPKPWEWSVAKTKISDSTVRVLSDQPPVAVGVTLDASGLGSAADAVGHAALALALAPGSVALEGDLRIAPLAFGGTLRIADLSLPPLVALSGALPPEAVAAAKLRTNLAITAGLPAKGGDAPADLLLVSGTVGLGEVSAVPPAAERVEVEMKDLELVIERAAVPGVIPFGVPAAPDAKLELAATLSLEELRVALGADQPIELTAAALVLKAPSLEVPAPLANLAPAAGVPVVGAALNLELDEPRLALADDTTFEARRIAFDLTGVQLPVFVSKVSAGAAPPPAKVAAKLDLEGALVRTAAGKELNAGAESITLSLTDVVVPGFVAGATPAAASEPIRAGATLAIAKLRVTRGDGKEFAIGATSVSVPLTELSLPSSFVFVPGAAGDQLAQSIHAVFGEVRVEEPVIVVTRTKDGIVLPVAAAASYSGTPPAAPAPSQPPPASLPVDLQVAALRVQRGRLSFTDRAVDPLFATRVSPIEIDARNVRYPGPVIEPLKVEIGTEPEGEIELSGKMSPEAGTMDLSIKQLALAPFNPYATAYSGYGIGDGSLSLTLKATSKGGSYEVQNDLTLHDLDLTGTEDDSGFEKQFGISLSLALALLRDTKGDIGLGIPMKVDRERGASVNVARVVRSALRQAIRGAIQSPLKMLGVGGGKKKVSLAPAPIAFRRGRAKPTKAGENSIERLADFLGSRPGLGVQLSSAPTASDARWLHEQALRAKWADENFFRRSLGFLTARGPRERIRAFLKARAKDKQAKLSDEDRATLDQWLTEIPPPSPERLRLLAAERLAAIEAKLGKRGIEAARIARLDPTGEPAEGKPVAMFNLRAVAGAGTEPGG